MTDAAKYVMTERGASVSGTSILVLGALCIGGLVTATILSVGLLSTDGVK